jgi:predicted amidohydrolase
LLGFAKESGAWILIGSVTIPVAEGRIANRSILISGAGEIVARYDKIHMFDATLPNGRSIRESSLYEPGNEAVLAHTPWGPIGLSICYDVRFPYLYRAAGKRRRRLPGRARRVHGRHRAAALACAAARTGHRERLLRHRTCNLRQHPGGHATFGHSLVVDPMGKIVADGGEHPGICYADIDVAETLRARGMMPSLTHTREVGLRVIGA